MSAADRATLSVAAGVTAFALVYLCAAFLEWPLLTYFIATGAWRITTHAPPEAIPFYGLVAWGVVAGVGTGVVAELLLRALAPRPPAPMLVALCTGWTLMSLWLASLYFLFRAVF